MVHKNWHFTRYYPSPHVTLLIHVMPEWLLTKRCIACTVCYCLTFHRRGRAGWVEGGGEGGGANAQEVRQTPSTSLRHPSFNKLQALVYDILPSITAVFSYAIGSRKLSANEQFFVGAQTAVSLLQTTQIISHVCFITDHVAYTSSNKTKIV